MKTEKLFFTQDAKVGKEIVYHQGKTYDVPVETGSAQRWIKRGVAHTVVEDVQKEVKVDQTQASEPLKEEVPEQTGEIEETQVEEISTEKSEEHPHVEEDVAKEKPKKENKNKKNPGKGL